MFFLCWFLFTLVPLANFSSVFEASENIPLKYCCYFPFGQTGQSLVRCALSFIQLITAGLGFHCFNGACYNAHKIEVYGFKEHSRTITRLQCHTAADQTFCICAMWLSCKDPRKWILVQKPMGQKFFQRLDDFILNCINVPIHIDEAISNCDKAMSMQVRRIEPTKDPETFPPNTDC